MEKAGFKKGFTLVELLIVIAILGILSVAAYIGIQKAQSRVMNERVMDDLLAISNALEQYNQDNGEYPLPPENEDQNLNCFNADTSYAHDCALGAFVEGMVDNKLLTKRYLQEVPADPRTGSRYVYGVSTDKLFYQVAGIHLEDDGTWSARVMGNLAKGYSLPSLIRAYDGPNFVLDNEAYLPYSPDHLSLTASLEDIVGTVTVNGQAPSGEPLVPGDIIRTDANSSVVIYFSDGSITYLGDVNDSEASELQILPNTEVLENDKDGIVTKIRLKLMEGKIWNKVARLASESEFNVETTSAIAGVRGTEFGIDDENQLVVLSGEVLARMKDTQELTEDVVDFSVLDNADFDETSDLAEGNGVDIVQYQLDDAQPVEPVYNYSNDPIILNTFIQRYYLIPVNESLIPRVLSVDMPTSISLKRPEPAQSSFAVYPTVTDVMAVVAYQDQFREWGTHPLHSWTLGQGDQSDPIVLDASSLPSRIAAVANYTNGSNLVRFRFRMSNGSLSGFSDPPVSITNQTVLSADSIYTGVIARNIGTISVYEPINITQTNFNLDLAGGGFIINPDLPQTIIVPDDIVIPTVTSITVQPAQQLGAAPHKMVQGMSIGLQAMAEYSDNRPPENISDLCNWVYTPQTLGNISSAYFVSNQSTAGNVTIQCTYGGVSGSMSVEIVDRLTAACYGPDLRTGGGDDAGVMQGSECWVMGAPGQSCTDACPALLKTPSGTAVSQCDTQDNGWDDADNSAICLALTQLLPQPLNPAPVGFGQADASRAFAPYFAGVQNRCYSRNDSITNYIPNLCGHVEGIGSLHKRICQCKGI